MSKIQKASQNSPSSSPISVSNLSHSLIIEILIKVPVKSVVRFRSVCKAWKNIISEKYFSALYSKNRRFTFLLNYYQNHNDFDKFDYESTDLCFDFVEIGLNGNNLLTQTQIKVPHNIPKTRHLKLVSSCNGLLCFKYEEFYHQVNNNIIYIINPLFGEIARLPKAVNSKHTKYGFGLCKQIDNYKVIGVVKGQTNIRFEIMTIGVDHKWRSLEDSSFKFTLFSDGVTYEGVVYFVCMENGRYDIFAFDLDKEEGSLIPFPSDLRPSEELREWPQLLKLSIFDGNLCLFCNDKNANRLDIWTMKLCANVVESWSKIELRKPSDIRSRLFPIAKSVDGDLLLSSGFNYLLSYNDKTEECIKVTDPKKGYDKFFVYVPNFVPLSTDPIIEKYCESLDSCNALEIAEISETCSNVSLKEAALSFILRNVKDVVFSTRFDAFVSKNPDLTVQITRALLTTTNFASSAP